MYITNAISAALTHLGQYCQTCRITQKLEVSRITVESLSSATWRWEVQICTSQLPFHTPVIIGTVLSVSHEEIRNMQDNPKVRGRKFPD